MRGAHGFRQVRANGKGARAQEEEDCDRRSVSGGLERAKSSSSPAAVIGPGSSRLPRAHGDFLESSGPFPNVTARSAVRLCQQGLGGTPSRTQGSPPATPGPRMEPVGGAGARPSGGPGEGGGGGMGRTQLLTSRLGR